MKKLLLTVFQLAVTVALLIWVYHDPNKRAQMAEALDIAPGTVLSRLARAREALKAAMRPVTPKQKVPSLGVALTDTVTVLRKA